MAINRFKDYESTKAYTEIPQLPKGGYIVKILSAEVKENSNGQYVQLACDIAEGEYKDFYKRDYNNQQGEDKKWHCYYLLNVPKDDGTERDGWTKRRFKTVITALEESNPKFHFDWDEKKLKGLVVGGLFNLREYEKNDGSVGTATNLAQMCDVESIHNGTFRMPNDKLLNKSTSSGGGFKTSNNTEKEPDFMAIPDGAEDDGLPF